VAAVGFIRLGRDWVRIVRLKRACRPFDSGREERLVQWQKARADGRRAQLMVSDRLSGASMLGMFRPCIAISRDLVALLNDHELDQIVLHELGHVRRRDDWARLLQAGIACIAGLHPAVWVIGRAIDLEREAACDEWAVARTGQARAYAASLVRVAESRSRHRAAMLAPALLGAEHHLAKRVDRVLDSRRWPHVGSRRSRLVALTGAAGLVASAFPIQELPPLIRERAVLVALASSPLGAPTGSKLPVRFAPRDERAVGEVDEVDEVDAQDYSRTPKVALDSRPAPTVVRHQSAPVRAPVHVPAAPPAGPLFATSHAAPIGLTVLPAVTFVDLARPPSRAAVEPVPVARDVAPVVPAVANTDGQGSGSGFDELADVGVAVGTAVQHASVKTAVGVTRAAKAFARAF
jgi:hypothetical protein